MHPREWLMPMLRVWRGQYLRIHRGYKVFPDGARHYDGWPTTTVIGRIKIDAEGAGQGGTFKQSFPEVYSGDGLLIWRAMDGMPIAPKEVLYAKMLSYESYRVQCKVLELKASAYFTLLDNAFYYLAGKVEGQDHVQRKIASERFEAVLSGTGS